MNVHLSPLSSRVPKTSISFIDDPQREVFRVRNLSLWKKGGSMALFPKPDRSTFVPKLTDMDENTELDNGWAESEFSDGRPYRAELWSWDHLSVITFFFSTIGVEDISDQELADLLQKEVSLQFKGSKKVSAEKIQDSSGNEMWSVSLLVRDGDETLLTLGVQFNSYKKIAARDERNASLTNIATGVRGMKL
jgi:hypothetical protein